MYINYCVEGVTKVPVRISKYIVFVRYKHEESAYMSCSRLNIFSVHKAGKHKWLNDKLNKYTKSCSKSFFLKTCVQYLKKN